MGLRHPRFHLAGSPLDDYRERERLHHAHLHRKYRPFSNATLTSYGAEPGRVRLNYDVLVGDGRFSKYFVDREKVNVNSMKLCFDYPYQWSNTGDRIKHWCFFLPMNAQRTRVFFIFYFDALRIPFTRWSIPVWLMRPVLAISKRLLIEPLLAQDGEMVQEELQAYASEPDAPSVELNPVVIEFQKLIVAKWREHLAAAQDGNGVGHPEQRAGTPDEPAVAESLV